MPQSTTNIVRAASDEFASTYHVAILTRTPDDIEVETYSNQLVGRSDELIERDTSLARTLRRIITTSKTLQKHLKSVLLHGDRIQLRALFLPHKGFDTTELSQRLLAIIKRTPPTVSLTWLDKPRDTDQVEPSKFQNAHEALQSLENLTFPNRASLADVIAHTEHCLHTIQAVAADKLAELIRPESLSDSDFFTYFDMLIERLPHSVLKTHFQRWLEAQEGRTFESFSSKRELAANIQQRLKLLNLRVECPTCEVPANFRCVRFGTSKTGQFGFGHRTGRSEDKHALSTAFPTVKLVPAPKDPRIKVI